MGIDTLENVCTLLSVTFGSLYALFKYIKTPRRGWLYLSAFFMMHLLSDYYWTIYTLVIGENPDVSAFMAYFGWNIGYLFMLLFAINMRPGNSKRFFHPLMLVPIPLGIWQFFIYIQFGGIFNNIWEGVLATSIACVSLQVILHYFKNRNSDFPFLHTVLLFFIIFEYGMWTSSCFDFETAFVDPYYIFAFAECISILLLGRATTRAYEQIEMVKAERSTQESRFTILLQMTVAVVIFFGGVGGYYAGLFMKSSQLSKASSPDDYRSIATALFLLSIFLVVFVMMIILMTTLRYKSIDLELPQDAVIKRSRFNFILTLIITFSLMITSVIYTSRLFYRVSVAGAMEDGQARVYSTAGDLENYLGVARSTLLVTADTVEIMLKDGASQDTILSYITKQTANQAQQFDENFTGIYAYINSEYMDGSGWIPPEGYNAESRDWYKAAVEGGGKTIIVPPYVDAQTGSVVITICKLLDDGRKESDYSSREVVALDMVVNHVAEIADTTSISGKGYAFVVGQDGMIIAHRDHSLTGRNVNEVYGEDFMECIYGMDNTSIEAVLDGSIHTLFIDNVIDQWYVIIAISDRELFAETYTQLLVNVLVSFIIFLFISFFYYLGYKNEQLNAKKMEEMRSNDLKRDYEAQILKQKEASANEANQAKSKFLAQMSHEIRTPINAILGMNEMILRTSKDANTLEYSGNIDSAGNTLLNLINTILDFSKIEDGKMEIIPANYSTSSFISDLINTISQRAESKGLELVTDIDENLPTTLFGDDMRLKQVIVNLLTNAVKYTETGSVKLTIKTGERSGDSIQLHVSVKDTGIGIRPEDINKLTLSFQRLDEQKTRHIEGTGLGMSIVSSLLTMMGSKICVESTYGEGSDFYFTITQKVIDDTPIGNLEGRFDNISAARSTEDLISAPGARVLVVDDNNLNLMVAKSLLTLCQINPDEASSGEDAIRMMSEKAYDIVLLDHMMPRMDGIETLNELQKQNLIPAGTIMIALTANAVVGAKEQYLQSGFDDYLSKPMEIKELVALLKKYLPKSAYDDVISVSAGNKTDDSSYPGGGIGADGDSAANGYGSDESEFIKNNHEIIESLKGVGIEADAGIEYCADADAYLEILKFFAKDCPNKIAALNDSYESQDWHGYDVKIHALKTNLRTLGMPGLGEKAFALEKAAKAADVDYIMANHSILMDEYRRIVESINNIFCY
ncbi:response regulator [Butyrivibrio sp. JL13D10]|uniref:hybrid sensor histidine kinase/response regulator n=1 Tax=Butyrivibrio sp. JL13D10 TaxID=3236815 RepID=UPI0038B64B8D